MSGNGLDLKGAMPLVISKNHHKRLQPAFLVVVWPLFLPMTQTKDKVINIKFREVHYSLKRLNDSQYYDFWKTSICIADDYRFYLDFYLFLRERGGLLNLAQVYIALKTLCGKSNNSFDKYKGSFSFPFLLEVRKAGKKFDYLLDIYDFRGSLYFGIRKLL